jgi:hypothetical protein
MLTLVVLIVVLAALAAGGTATLVAYRTSRRRALLDAVNALRFGAYVALIRRAMERRGYVTECRLGGAAGYEMQARRDDRRLLVACKLGATVRVTARSLLALDAARATDGAHGIVVFTSGTVDADARACASERDIEIVEGSAFLREVRRALSDDTKSAVVEGTRATLLRHARHGLVVGMLCAAAGASAVAIARHL